ncbi:CotH kinase family protein [Gluconobacter kondonii]|nr:CotH kinase family protein [Gluconobacter kondonii]
MPTRPWRILVEGALPTDKGGVPCSVSFFEGTIPLFSASGTWQTQGQTSSYANKKNWKFKLRNAATGNKLLIKIGGWFAMSSITTKGYGTDRTLMRDSLTTDLWRQMHMYPSGFLAPLSAYDYFKSSDCGVQQSALFSTAGFPVEIWQNGSFLGLYVLRADNDPSTYLMDDSNPQHVLIQPQHAGDMWNKAFDSTLWDFPSPSVSGYDTGDDMSTLNAGANSAAARVMNWMVSCVQGASDFRSTYSNYLDLTSALDFILITEISMSFDSLNNNFMMGSWNATADGGIWRFWPYDEDETFGVVWFLSNVGQIYPDFGWVTDDNVTNGIPGGQPPGIFKVIREQMRPELRARWRDLRDAGIISSQAVNAFLKKQGAMIDPASMQQDLANWSLTATDGNQLGAIIAAQSVGYISTIAAQRIAWLDQQWGYSA